MRRLILDTATENCSVALFEGEQLIGADSAMLGRGHAEHLLPMVAALPDKGRADHIHVNCGPGSFTGIRVGIAAAKALQFAWGSNCTGYSTHMLLAHMALAGLDSPDEIGVAILGGHGEFFVQQLTETGECASGMHSMVPRDAAVFLPQHHIVGSASEALVALRGHGTAHGIWPVAKHALAVAIKSCDMLPHPIYGREADAKPSADRVEA